jgi:ribose transport system ATP-binding protein
VRGRQVQLPLAPGRFRDLGVEFVHQDLGLVPALTVTENLRIGSYATGERRFWLSRRREHREAAEVFARYELTIDPSAQVRSLPPVQRALLAIVRAAEGLRNSPAARDGGLLILDEPTVFLPGDDVQRLYELIRAITGTGSSALFVSHDLDEVLQITDRVTVLRDGHLVGTVDTAAATADTLVEMIVGRRLRESAVPARTAEPAEVHCTVTGLRAEGIASASFDVHRGEILGVTGLVGSGFDEVPYGLYGAGRDTSGTLSIGGDTIDLAALRPDRAVAAGIALIPADRGRDASIGSLSVADNIALPVLGEYFNGVALRRGPMARKIAALMSDLDVRPNDQSAQYSSLSGGNQQKAVLAKWLQTHPRLLLLHEPTQGVDVGARRQLFAAIRAAADEGAGVVCASTDHEQLAELCDRVLIFAHGRITHELKGADIQKERMTELSFGAAGAAGQP